MSCLSSWTSCAVVLFAISSASAAGVGLPADFVKECEYYLGDWLTEVEIEGEVYRGEWIVRWSPDNTCLVTHWAADHPTGLAQKELESGLGCTDQESASC